MDPLMGIMSPAAPHSASRLSNGPGRVDNATAAREMESLFISELIKAMRQTVPQSGLLDGGRGEEVMRSIQDQKLADSMARQGGFGLARALLDSLNQTHPEGAPESTPAPKSEPKRTS